MYGGAAAFSLLLMAETLGRGDGELPDLLKNALLISGVKLPIVVAALIAQQWAKMTWNDFQQGIASLGLVLTLFEFGVVLAYLIGENAAWALLGVSAAFFLIYDLPGRKTASRKPEHD